MRLPVIALLALLPLAVCAAEEPEEIYAKYHRAAIAGDQDGLLAHSPARQRTEIKAMSAASRQASLMMVKSMMPRTFTVERRTTPGENRATLVVSGPWESGPGGSVQVYGTAQLLRESGDWKVSEVSWTTERPAILSTPQTAPPPTAAAPTAAEKAKGKPAPVSTKGAPVVGSMAAEAPGSKLGAAKPECVYKPVMTAKDMENCK